MLLKKLGDDRILLGQLFLCRVELGFQIPFVDAIFGGLKGLLPVLEQLTLPLVEHADLDPHLLADRGDRHAFHKVPPDRPDLLLAVKVPPRLPVLAHRQPSSSVSPYYATDFGDCPFPREAAHPPPPLRHVLAVRFSDLLARSCSICNKYRHLQANIFI